MQIFSIYLYVNSYKIKYLYKWGDNDSACLYVIFLIVLLLK